MSEKMFCVGYYTEKFNTLTGQALPCCEIMQSDGLAVHVQKHHPNEYGNIALIPSIIAEPDSVELVKVIDANVMVCVKLDRKHGYHYVASVYEISNGKLQNRIKSGRLMKFSAGL